MRSRLTAFLLAAAVVLLPSACGPRSKPPTVAPARPAVAAPAGPLRIGTETGVRSVPLEDYVAGCVAAELGSAAPSGEDASRNLRAVQAILCRSYAVASRARHTSAGFDLCATSHCQVYRPVPGNQLGRLSRAAAEATRGLILTFDGRAIAPIYHASCGGSTSAADQVWAGTAVPWLVALKDEACSRTDQWTFSVELQRLGRALASDTRLALRLPLRDVTIDRRDGAGRAALLRLQAANTVVVRGDQFRGAVMKAFGARSLRSTLFSVARAGRHLTFRGRGYGHGVGLCQAGALRLAGQGQSPESILRHFYPGTRLGRID